jgi:hypothetical protein
VPFALLREALLAALGVPADVLGQRDALGAHLAGQLDHLGDRVTRPDDQVGAEAAQRLPQVGQALVQEESAVRGELLQARVEDEERDDLLRVRAGAGEGRVVVHPQVTGEQDDGGPHVGSLLSSRLSSGRRRSWVCPVG